MSICWKWLPGISTWIGLLIAVSMSPGGQCANTAGNTPIMLYPQTQTMKLVVSGLAGHSTVTVQDGTKSVQAGNGSLPLMHVGNGYNIVITQQPPGQTCTVVDGTSSTVNSASPPIKVICSGAYGIGGTVSGLKRGERVVLSEGGAVDLLTVNSNGPFQFARLVMPGYAYQVDAELKPDTRKCNVAHESGTVGNTDITDISIRCALDPDLDGEKVGIEDSDLVDITEDKEPGQAQESTESGCRPRTFYKLVVLSPDVHGWFLTKTCGGSGGQSFSLLIENETTILEEFGTGFVILRSQTNGMPDLTVLHAGPGAQPERYRFDGKVYKSARNSQATPRQN